MIYVERPEGFDPKVDVSSCIIVHDNTLLLLLRHEHKPQGNTWCIPAGKCEPGESPLQTIVRELREETGHAVEPTHMRFVQTYFVRYPNFDFVYHTFHLLVDEKPEIILEASAHKEFRWVTPEEALKLPLIPGEETCLRDFFKI